MKDNSTTRPVVVLFATNNPGKVDEARKFFALAGVHVVSLLDIGLNVDAPENHMTLEQNATEKTSLCNEELLANHDENKYIIVGDDTGLEIECLNGEPGTRVRRWAGYKMPDEEIISHCLARMEGFQRLEQRRAKMRTAICVKFPESHELPIFTGELNGHILRTADPMRIEGFPLESLFFVDECGKLLGDVQRMEGHEKSKYPTHREKALLLVLEEIKVRYRL